MEKAVWFYKVGEEKSGPHSHQELQELFDRGDIDSTTKIWSEGFAEWLPIAEVEYFNMSILDETPTVLIKKEKRYVRETDPVLVRPRPWVRFWARMIDYALFLTVLSFGVGIFDLQVDVFMNYFGVIAIFLWVFIEALLLTAIGTTPGKWMLRVQVRDEYDQKLSFSSALNRSFSVWWLGVGAGLPIVMLITMIVAAVKLNNTGLTSWDRRGEIHIIHRNVGAIRTLIVILFFLCYTWVVFWRCFQLFAQPT